MVFEIDISEKAYRKPTDFYDRNISPLVIKKLVISKAQRDSYLRKMDLVNTLARSHVEQIEQEFDEERYVDNILGVTADNKIDLELTGLANHARDNMLIVDLSDKLDYVLSEIFNEDVEQVRDRLEVLASEIGLSYIEISKAVMSQESYLLRQPGMSLELFTRISRSIESFIMQSLSFPMSVIVDSLGNPVDLSEYNLDEFEKATAFLYAVVLRHTEFILKEIFDKYYGKIKRTNPKDYLIGSKGFSLLVIQSNKPVEHKLLLKGNVKDLALDVTCISRTGYVEELMKCF